MGKLRPRESKGLIVRSLTTRKGQSWNWNLGFFDSKFSALPLTLAAALGQWQSEKGEKREFVILQRPLPWPVTTYDLNSDTWAFLVLQLGKQSHMTLEGTYPQNPRASVISSQALTWVWLCYLFFRVSLWSFSIKISLQSPTPPGDLLSGSDSST